MVENKGDLELILVVFKHPEDSKSALKSVRDLHKLGRLKLLDAATIQRNKEGKTSSDEIHDLEAWRGSIFGAIAGALVGFLGGPAGVVIGGSLGAATGGILSRSVDLGFSNDFLRELELNLRPGNSALLVLVESPCDDSLFHSLQLSGGIIMRHLLKANVVERLWEAQDEN